MATESDNEILNMMSRQFGRKKGKRIPYTNKKKKGAEKWEGKGKC